MAADRSADAAAVPRVAPSDALCPRCGGGFHCGANDAAPCVCTALHLTAATLGDLRSRYHGCLCMQCLRTLAQM